MKRVECSAGWVCPCLCGVSYNTVLFLAVQSTQHGGFYAYQDRWRDEDKHVLFRPGLGERFTCLLNRAVSVLGLLKKSKEPLTAWVRDKPKKFLNA